MQGPRDYPEPLITLIKRVDVLEVISYGCTHKREIEDDLDISRATIDRAIRRLDDCGIVERDGPECQLTLYGRLLLETYQTLSEEINRLAEAQEILSALPDETKFNTNFIANAKITTCTSASPLTIYRKTERVLRQSNHIRGIYPVLPPYSIDLLESLDEQGTTLELICSDEVIEEMVTNYGERLTGLFGTDKHNLFRGQGEALPIYRLLISDNAEVILLAYNENMSLCGGLFNTSRSAIEWGEQRFKQVCSETEIVNF